MSILNEASDGTLSVLIALRDTLRSYGPLTRARLLALCAPSTVTDGKKAKDTLRRWTQLGFFEEVDGTVQLAEEVAEESCDDPRGLRAALTQIVLREANTPGFDDGASPEDADENGGAALSLATDFATAAAWCLLQDPFTSCSTWTTVEDLLRTQKIPISIQNPVRWNGFVRWSSFLGFSVTLPSSAPKSARPILINPAAAAWDVIEKVLPKGKKRDLGEVLEELAKHLPVLPGGKLSTQVASRIEVPSRTYGPHEVPPSVALALLQWRAMGKVQLTRPSDAGHRSLLGRRGAEVAVYSTIERLV
jgi:hypothetical protein